MTAIPIFIQLLSLRETPPFVKVLAPNLTMLIFPLTSTYDSVE